MWMPSRSVAAFLFSALTFLGATPGLDPAGAQEAPPASSAEPLLEIFQPLPLEGGIALIPRASLNGIRTVEIRGPEAVINGSPVTREVISSWLQEAAPPVLELLELTASEQRSRFGFEPLAAAPAETVAPPPAEALRPSSVEAAQPPPVEAAQPPPVEAAQPPPVEAAPSPPEPLRPREKRERGERVIHSDARVSIGKRVVIEENEVAEDVVVIGGSLVIDGEVLGDALAVGGAVRVDGRVSGDVAAVGGTVYLEDDAQVHGDVVSVGGGIERDPDAMVFGELTEVSVGSGLFDRDDWFDFDPGAFAPRWPRPFRSAGRFFGGVAKMIFLTLIAGLVLLILPQQTRRAEAVLAAEPWKAGVVGLVALLVFWVVLVPALVIACFVLAITIIGIPVALLLALAFVLFTVAIALLGYTSAASRLGSWFAERFSGRFESRFVRLLIGILLIEVWLLLASVLGGGGWLVFLPVLLLGTFGGLIEFAAWTMGLGAVLTSWYEGREAGSSGASGTSPEAPPYRPLPPLPGLPPEEELEAEFRAAREDGPVEPPPSPGGSFEEPRVSPEPPGGAEEAAEERPGEPDASAGPVEPEPPEGTEAPDGPEDGGPDGDRERKG